MMPAVSRLPSTGSNRLVVALLVCAAACGAGCRSALRPLAELAAFTGVREGEAVDVDLARADADWRTQDPAAVRRAQAEYLRAAGTAPDRVEAWTGYVRAGVWLADRVDDRDERRALAGDAVEGAQWCLEHVPGDVECRYWLALAIGVQARERRSTGLDALPRIVELLEGVLAERPDYDRAGPERVLALLYLRAPDWPAGPGDLDLGLEYAEAAVAREGTWPPNQLALGEALERLKETGDAEAVYRRARDLAAAEFEKGNKMAVGWVEEADAALAGLGG